MSEANVRVIYTERKRLPELQDETDGGHTDGGRGDGCDWVYYETRLERFGCFVAKNQGLTVIHNKPR